MSLLDILTGGESGNATSDEQQALADLQNVQTPTVQGLTLPQLQQYAVSQNMSPAQMQAFIQQYNALANENVSQTGTSAQEQAIGQLANVANAGAAGTPVEQAQIAQALQQANTNLAGQEGAINQAAEARGVAPGLLQAALATQTAGQNAQNTNQAALQAQSQAYQTALNAMSQGASAGNALQGQQNTQANTIAQAQNAMQQFNAANQQQASAQNAGYQQAANQYNTGEANQVGQANTGLANQRTEYNAALPQQVYNDQMQQAQAEAGEQNQMANTATGQGQQTAGIYSGLIGAGATLGAGALGAPASGSGLTSFAGMGSQASTPPAGSGYTATGNPSFQPTAIPYTGQAHGGIITQDMAMAKGGVVNPIPAHYDCGHSICMANGGICMKKGGMIPGKAKVPGDSEVNDTVPIRVSPGEAVVPRTVVQQNPADVMRLLAQGKGQAPQQPGQMQSGHHPQDVAALLAAMKHMRGTR